MVPTQGYNMNYHILQTPSYVAILHEMFQFRIIPLDGRPHVDQRIGQWLGDARGRWAGDTSSSRPGDRAQSAGSGPWRSVLNWCSECYKQSAVVDWSLGFSLRNEPERPHDIEVDLAGIWGDPDTVIAAVRDALAAADIDPGDFLEAVRPAVDDDDELLITCRAWVHVDVGGRTSAP